MALDLTIKISWHRITESYVYPEKWWDGISKTVDWRAQLCISGDFKNVKTISTKGFTAHIDWRSGLTKWGRINQVDKYDLQENSIGIWLPFAVEPDDSLFLAKFQSIDEELQLETFCPECPQESVTVDPLGTRIEWLGGKSTVDIVAADNFSAAWITQEDGTWSEATLPFSFSIGHQTLPLEIPFSEVSYLEIKTNHGSPSSIHRYYCVGRPGVASGRHLWYRGTMYSPKLTRALPWISVIAPVLHPDDIERVPAFVKWNQIQWWVHPGTWADEAVEMIAKKFPNASIIRLGALGDNIADIQVIRPLEVQGHELNPSKRYAVRLFDDVADVEYSRRSGWLMERLQKPDVQHLRFIENAWRQSLATQNPIDGQPQYGFSFSFARPPEHEYLWTPAQRDLDWRENHEGFPCNTCKFRSSCRQNLPIPYEASQGRKVPWLSLETGQCPLPVWFEN